MSSSISSSSAPWRRFFGLAVGVSLGVAAVLYGFVAMVDPWDVLPFSPPFKRAPVTTNLRYSYAGLARGQRFDSAIIGTSTSRLLRPEALNPAFGATFVNLAMDAATPYEQARLLGLFMAAHPDAKTVLLGLDVLWCGTGDNFEKITARGFPEWMYDAGSWRGYAELFSLFAVREAAAQFAYLTRLRKARQGLDGYTNPFPDDGSYEPERVRAKLSQPEGPGAIPAPEFRFPAHPLLADMLGRLPAKTRKVLFFTPYYLGRIGLPGSHQFALWQACKARTREIAARVPNTVLVDFMLPSPITTEPSHYWDDVHYRIGVADQVMADLARANVGEPSAHGHYGILLPQR